MSSGTQEPYSDIGAMTGAGEDFAAWTPSAKERSDMIEVAAYHIAQRRGFESDPQACWAAGEAQVDLMLSLRESQFKLQTVFENALDAVVMIDADGIITGWNRQATRIFGWAREEAVGRVIHDVIIPPRHRAAHAGGMAHYLATGEGPILRKLIEVEALHRDGHEFPVELTIAPLRTAGRLEFNAFIRDITGRKRIERIQSARVRLMDYAAKHSLKELLVATLDEAGALTDSPIGFYHFLGADQKTLSLQAWSTRTTQEFCQAAGEGSHYNVDQAGVWVECIHLRRPVIHNDYDALPGKHGLPPGHAAVLREMVIPVFRGDSIVAILGVGNKPTEYTAADLETASMLADLAWDTAENKRAAEALRESEERWKFALEGAGEGVWDWNVQAQTVNYSPRWKEMLGYTDSEIGNTPDEWKQRVHPDDLAGAQAVIQSYFAGETPDYVIEHRMRCKDGSWRWMLSRGMLVSRSADGNPLRVIGTHADITERMAHSEELERQVQQRTAQLRAMSIELTMVEERERQLLAQDLHDGLGQTLAIAKLRLSALEPPGDDCPFPEQLKAEIAAIESLIDRANQTVRSLSLQLSPPALHDLGLASALQWLADELQRSYGLHVHLHLDPDTRQPGENVLNLVFRATRELLLNVARHACVDVADVSTTYDADCLVIAVTDSGVGFDANHVSRPSATGGFGLFSVRERIHFIGGDVQIDSSPGDGTIVVLTVPLIAKPLKASS